VGQRRQTYPCVGCIFSEVINSFSSSLPANFFTLPVVA
jgi:hypothetical protein